MQIPNLNKHFAYICHVYFILWFFLFPCGIIANAVRDSHGWSRLPSPKLLKLEPTWTHIILTNPTCHRMMGPSKLSIAFYRNVDFPIRAFIVPDSLRASKPEAFFPQVVGFGPLHHSRLQVQSMQHAHWQASCSKKHSWWFSKKKEKFMTNLDESYSENSFGNWNSRGSSKIYVIVTRCSWMLMTLA